MDYGINIGSLIIGYEIENSYHRLTIRWGDSWSVHFRFEWWVGQ